MMRRSLSPLMPGADSRPATTGFRERVKTIIQQKRKAQALQRLYRKSLTPAELIRCKASFDSVDGGLNSPRKVMNLLQGLGQPCLESELTADLAIIEFDFNREVRAPPSTSSLPSNRRQRGGDGVVLKKTVGHATADAANVLSRYRGVQLIPQN
eukprot:NODE_679_length_1228_cov_282.175573_g490_i0.p1 GENE.NODE_679_length_1228_cov_282.175573_g490_i0~~NODE_679_length_1228_cov_282.175573_g490_i0.p1  ORF type:complete len:154 (+),score=16.50 NODE_679_length_1228_cov_282.175573_g490_i0:157-618(+)